MSWIGSYMACAEKFFTTRWTIRNRNEYDLVFYGNEWSQTLWTHFRLGRNATVPDTKTTLLWVANFRATGLALKKEPPGRPHSVWSPQNVQALRRATTQSPQCSVRKHAAAMGMSEWSVRRILHADLNFHPYKMMVVQEPNQNDWVNRSDSCQAIL
jgi:hypothetical protein